MNKILLYLARFIRSTDIINSIRQNNLKNNIIKFRIVITRRNFI